jgi:amino acid adenylation domain-containing protein
MSALPAGFDLSAFTGQEAPAGSPGSGGLLPMLFAAQASRTPLAPAVIDASRQISYRELDRRANHLAYFLRGQGVGPETLVGVCLSRSADLVVALLAVWKAGGAYVPLDPSHPADRIQWIVADTGLRLVIADESSGNVFTGTDARPVSLDGLWHAQDGLPDGPPDLRAGRNGGGAAGVDPGNAAYVIYTSGSTGRPKGVVVTHAGIANRVQWTVTRHRLGAADRTLQKTSLGFDAACWEFFAPLVSGGVVVMAEPGAERDPAAMVRAVIDHRITVLQGAPSVLRALAAEPQWAQCRSLRLVFSAGEPLHGALAAQLAAVPGVEVWNTYGPTECSVDVTAQPFDPAGAAGPVPIGKPIDNVQALVLDGRGDPVPVGVAGELYAGGVGLARGYLHRAELTADRFVPDPYGNPGERLYRTGDLVRWRADGTLDFLGRIDDQVKINGVRIEPGEVEAALLTHPDIESAVVIPHAEPDGDKRLLAYLLARRPVQAEQLRGYLRDRLPEVFIPAGFVTLDEFPLNANGKVNRVALPAPEVAIRHGRPPFEPPTTEAESIVARVWSDLLGVQDIGLQDDFFSLGGESLMLTRLAGRLRAEIGGNIDLRGLFDASTVRAQAQLLAPIAPTHRPETVVLDTVPVLPRDRALPLSFGQHRLWFLDRLHPGSAEWVAPVFLRIPADIAVQTVRRALYALEERHESLRTRYIVVDDEPAQLVVAAAPVELRVVDGAVDDLTRLFGEQFERGFDLADGPLWRALLVRLPGQDHVLLMTVHHIASDGWSAVVLEREVRELCVSAHQGRPAKLGPLPVQYADFASWQRAQLTDDVTARELGYWREALTGLEPLNLPTDRARPLDRDPAGAGVEVLLPRELTDAVLNLAGKTGTTPFMTMLAAWATTLARHSGQSEFALGTPLAGRHRTEFDNVVGLFLNPIALPCNLSGNPTFTTTLDRIRQSCVLAQAHQQIPFERLVDELEPNRDLSRTPLYQVAFDLQFGDLTTSGTADPLAAQAFQRAWRVAKTDVTLFVWQRSDGTMTGALEYSTSLFDESTVRRLAEHFVRVLETVTADPGIRLSEIDMLTADERQRVLVEFNENAGRRREQCVHEMFQSRALASPDAVAVEFGSQRLTYAQLDSRADELADRLIAGGVRPGQVVGVLLDRGPDLVAAMLAAWKAGAAYLPMEPSWPDARLGDVLAAAGSAVLLTDSTYGDRSGVPTVLVDVPPPLSDAVSSRPRSTDPDLAAYVIFTSGSTGRPKGVQISHRNLANHLVTWGGELLGNRSGGTPLFSSVAFDLVVTPIWAPLVHGQRLCLLPPELELSELGTQLLRSAPYAYIKLTPGHLDVLGSQLTDQELAGLAGVFVVGGEPLPPSLANRWLEILGPGRLINEYGPTEITVSNCIHPVVAPIVGPRVPIGRPMPNTTMYILDANMTPVPAGVVGELYVGGAGVGRGYIGEPALTADRFLPNQFGAPGSRLYRTGDLARWLGDGSADMIGRADDQVKIRGYRIEPGEIRTVLLELAQVRDAVVVAKDGRLIAYTVPVDPALPMDAIALQQHCAGRLPEYMVPTVFVGLAAIPLTPNGKIDRRQLPDPDEMPGSPTPVAPRTPVEERIWALWNELGVTAGVDDRFFQVGGNSILVVRLISRIQAEFDINLPIQVLFERPTIAGMAAAVEEQIRAEIAALSDDEVLAEASALSITTVTDGLSA